MQENENRNVKEYEIWQYLCRELSKLNNIIYAYNKIFFNIEIKDKNYGQIFQLILDSFTRNISVSIDLFFQKRKDVWSLYSFDKINKNEIEKIKKKAQQFIIMRNNKIAHLSNNITHKDNFQFFTLKGINQIREIVKEMENLLKKVSDKYEFRADYIFNWQMIDSSLDCLINDLKKYDLFNNSKITIRRY